MVPLTRKLMWVLLLFLSCKLGSWTKLYRMSPSSGPHTPMDLGRGKGEQACRGTGVEVVCKEDGRRMARTHALGQDKGSRCVQRGSLPPSPISLCWV
ncbi:hypothetical protein M569_17673 [Genlisea aurea]|uniref:Secreted protein n=1 Tax=Genlisea aurea TaxID=192259 RepID=S8D386_9LAMI|nr:hypothetical protein M569_17673 [Genlisea aurea]